MDAVAKPQDLPPSGGYKKIPFARVPAKTYFSGYSMIAGYVGITAAGLYVYFLTCKKIKREEIEMRSARHCILPLLIAERDREYLKQLKRNRDEESNLMKNVDGWKVGTWYGEPIYKNQNVDVLNDPIFKEYYAHTHYKHLAKRADLKLWS